MEQMLKCFIIEARGDFWFIMISLGKGALKPSRVSSDLKQMIYYFWTSRLNKLIMTAL